MDAMIYSLACKLGQSEKYICENYSREMIFERKAIEAYQGYCERKLMEK